VRRLSVLLLIFVTGCGAAGNTDSTEDFTGEERAVAQVVEDLQRAGERGDSADICRDILAPALVRRLDQGATTCAAEMGRAIDDADDFDLVVEDVNVTGTTAQATVRRRTGEGDQRTVVELAKAAGVWRATELAAGG
jgi:hypothetical protein